MNPWRKWLKLASMMLECFGQWREWVEQNTKPENDEHKRHTSVDAEGTPYVGAR